MTAREIERQLHAFLARRAKELKPNKEQAAALLGVEARTLRRWSQLQSLGMPSGAQGSEPVPVTGGQVACAWGKYRLDVFVCATDGRLYRASTMGDWSEGARKDPG